jgi:hypothetical protein
MSAFHQRTEESAIMFTQLGEVSFIINSLPLHTDEAQTVAISQVASVLAQRTEPGSMPCDHALYAVTHTFLHDAKHAIPTHLVFSYVAC